LFSPSLVTASAGGVSRHVAVVVVVVVIIIVEGPSTSADKLLATTGDKILMDIPKVSGLFIACRSPSSFERKDHPNLHHIH
jgi:hypothetical protein